MRVLLVNPVRTSRNSTPPLGLGYLSSYLRAQGHTTRAVEVGRLVKRNLVAIAQTFQPDVVGLGVWCLGYLDAVSWARYFAAHFPNAIRVAGGPLAFHIPDDLLREQLFHYVILGPGELAMAQLLDEIDQRKTIPGRNIKGVYYLNHQKPIEPAEEISDLDSLPFPDRDPEGNYVYPNAIMVNRGCNGHCLFCVPQRRGIKTRSIANVMREVDHNIASSQTSHILFVDDNLAAPQGNISELCSNLLKRSTCTWSAQVRADTRPDTLYLMRESGCTTIAMGVESGNDDVLRAIHKGVTLRDIENTVRLVRSLGIELSLYYILGHYCDTPETMQDTLDHAERMKNTYGVTILLCCNTVFPGSPQYRLRDTLGLKIHAQGWDEYDYCKPSISGRGFTLSDLREKYFQSFEQTDNWVEKKYASLQAHQNAV